ncbi:hypothetical protein [Listeria fleischmannii]|uniref:TcdA-E operon negative regulator n=1 Tax=Listeria fleischmannii FSL S10-1203 TaxID=1265822 RepID=W7DLL9_9LIST|nr:hypothetical protein [Listeria fleischmannii]EUJ53829.1 hypothetical protein MCOL2_10490 [Listeria fleischmannii FSL S10-1203]
MIGFSIFMLFLGFVGLITGIILIVRKKTRKPGIYTTVASVVCGIVFSIVFVVGVVNEGAKAIDDSSTDTNISDTQSDDNTNIDEDDSSADAADVDEEKASEERVKETRQKASENEKSLRYGDLIKSDEYDGEPYHITKGKVFQADESSDGTTLLVYLTDTGDDVWDDLILVKYQIGETDAIEDDYVEVFGSLEERTTYETKIGGENTVPTLNAAEVKVIQ